MRRGFAAVLVFLCCLLAAAAGAEATATPVMLSAQERQTDTLSMPVTLYFRYLDTGLLGREAREVSFSRSGSREKAIVAALIDGPGSLSPQLNPLFPPGTQILSVISEGDRLFLTFNEALMNRYSDEAVISSAEYRQGEGLLRRKLAMASLVNSLTESGQYSSVQVLVRGETFVAASMRLPQRYYLEDSNALPPPLTRQESYVLGPQSAAAIFMASWQSMNWQRGLRLIKSDGTDAQTLPPEHELRQLAENAPKLLSYSVSPGVVALDGRSAVVCVDYRLLMPNGQESDRVGKPLKVYQSNGVYTISYGAMLSLLEISP